MNKTLDLRKLDNDSLQRINFLLSRLVDIKNGKAEKAIFNDTDLDLEDVEKQAIDYVSRRKKGYRNLENPEDDDIRNGIRDFLKKRAVYRPEKNTDSGVTYPQF